MPVLTNSKHEKFAQLIASGVSATKAYLSAGYSKASAAQNASRLITNDKVLARIKELQATISEGVVSLEIRKRSARVQALQVNLDRMRALIEARARRVRRFPGRRHGHAGPRFPREERRAGNLEVRRGAGGADHDTLKQARSPTRAATSSPSVLDHWK